MIPSLIAITPQKNFTLSLIFDTGEMKQFDMKPFLDTGLFRELRDERIFHTARIHFGTVEWSNGLDFDPESLYEGSVPLS